jgi:hypothetical protein
MCADTRVYVWAGKIKRRQAGGGAKKGARMDDDSGDDSDRVSQVILLVNHMIQIGFRR